MDREHFQSIDWLMKRSVGLKNEEPVKTASVYPNPTNGLVSITGMLQNKEATFDFFDVQGRKVFSQKKLYSTQTIDLKHLPNGLYNLRVSDGKMGTQHRLVKR